MRHNYLIFYNAYWQSAFNLKEYPPVFIADKIKLYINKSGGIDKRTKEYRELIRSKPKYYESMISTVETNNEK